MKKKKRGHHKMHKYKTILSDITISGSPKIISNVLILCSFTVVIFLIYLNSLNSPFIFDDDLNIVENPHIRMTELRVEGLRDAGFKSVMSTRPVETGKRRSWISDCEFRKSSRDVRDDKEGTGYKVQSIRTNPPWRRTA